MTSGAATLKLELRLVTTYGKSLIIMLGSTLVVSLLLGTPSIIQVIILVYLLMYVGIPFQLAEKSGLNLLYASLGVGRGTVVAGRYVTNLLMGLAGMALTVVLSLITSAVTGAEYILLEGIVMVCALLLVFLVLTGIQIPLFFKLGYANARLLSYLPMLLLFVVVMLAEYIVDLDALLQSSSGPLTFMEEYPALFAAGMVLAGLALYAVSFAVSRAVYAGKDLS